MMVLPMKTYTPKKEDIEKKWYLVDASGLVLGRLATRVASILRGKDKPLFTPHLDLGDFVVVINAEKVRLTGNKLSDKVYYHHTGYPGGLMSITAGKLLNSKPEEVITMAVWGMLPKGKLGRAIIKKLKVYRGENHPHTAQMPEPLIVKG
jgi:large subunit ribosomal protein L13